MLRILLTAGGVVLGLLGAVLIIWIWACISYNRSKKGISWTTLSIIHGSSMEPTLHEGDFLYARRITRWHRFEPGCIYLFWDPRKPEQHNRWNHMMLIKRLDKIMPDGTLYFLGDNRNYSTDSRMFGPVPPELVRYKALAWKSPGQIKGKLAERGKEQIMNNKDGAYVEMIDE